MAASDEQHDTDVNKLAAEAESQTQRSGAQNNLSTFQLLTICIAQLNEATQITMPYTMAVYMVRDFLAQGSEVPVDEEEVGKMTGLLAACFCAAQFVSSFPWGRASDKVGRKPMLIMSNLSSCISIIAFGLSSNFRMAAICRLLGGLFNCTFVCIKSMIGESCDVESQARPLSYLSLCWGVGTVIGPSLGGVLSRPCETFGHKFPFCEENQILQKRPYFLPCLAVGIFSFIAALSSIFFVRETLPSLVVKEYQALPSSELDSTGSLVKSLPETELVKLAESDPLAKTVPSQDIEQPADLEGPEKLRDFLARTDTASHLCSSTKLPVDEPSHRDAEYLIGHESDGTAPLLEQSELSATIRQLEKIQAEEELAIKWYRDKQILLLILGYVNICLWYNLLDEVTPIYASASKDDGGLQLTTAQLAVPLASGGISIFIWNMFFYPAYQRYFGVLNACRLALILSIPLAAALAGPSLLPLNTVGYQTALSIALFFKNICATNAFTSVVIMINTVAPQKDMGSVNGASQASAAFVRAFGPAMGGLMWGFSVSIPVKAHQVLSFVVTALGFLIPLFVLSLVNKARVKQK